MPLLKYYCDYCDKQFQDTPAARKRHLQGAQHLRARALWYDALNRDLSGGLIQPDGTLAKGVCHHFVRTGFCMHGDNCKYLHPKQNFPNPTQSLPSMVQSSILFSNQVIGGSSLSGNVVGDQTGISYDNLPPSLRPPPEGGYPALPFIDWG